MSKSWALVAVSAMLMAGCGTLDPTGPYHGDKVLYDADVMIATSYETIHTFVTWEYVNRQSLASKPAIKVAADKMRTDAPRWFATALALRDSYQDNPNDGTRDALQRAVDVLRTAMIESTKYLQSAALEVK